MLSFFVEDKEKEKIYFQVLEKKLLGKMQPVIGALWGKILKWVQQNFTHIKLHDITGPSYY